MTRIQVQAGQHLLEFYAKTPLSGLCELMANELLGCFSAATA